MRFVLFAILLGLLPNEVLAQLAPSPLNPVILEQIKKMPSGGQYSASRTATIRLQSAAHFESGKFSFSRLRLRRVIARARLI
ncbi:MAG: hypothetical protein M3480_11115 [Verrucomicrobiota bacterium]|nr:hypothetical protein [Verrucomicrobiota bacterium]